MKRNKKTENGNITLFSAIQVGPRGILCTDKPQMPLQSGVQTAMLPMQTMGKMSGNRSKYIRVNTKSKLIIKH